MTGIWFALAIVAFVALAALLPRAIGPVTSPEPVGVSPLDEAERILAKRYARGRITADEYERMTAILRR